MTSRPIIVLWHADTLARDDLTACSVLNPSLSDAERVAAADEAVAASGDDVVGSCWGTFPTRATAAGEVLTATHFRERVT